MLLDSMNDLKIEKRKNKNIICSDFFTATNEK